jgi:hypothetical protein
MNRYVRTYVSTYLDPPKLSAREVSTIGGVCSGKFHCKPFSSVPKVSAVERLHCTCVLYVIST